MITRYRPQYFKEMIGQQSAVRALSAAITSGDSQQFLLSGPSGVGKTTLARITAAEMGVPPADVIEIDAASHSGIDDMRAVQEVARSIPFGENARRAIIIDEAHGLSKQAWDSLLKITEDPPRHVVWFLCTTNESKVPDTVKQRFMRIQLKAVSRKELGDLCDDVLKSERINLPAGAFEFIVDQAEGSPRKLLGNIALCRNARDRKEVAELLRTVAEENPVIDLCRYLIKGRGTWVAAMALIDKIDAEPEGVRIVVVNYLGGCLRKARSDQEAIDFITILENWAIPFNSTEKQAPLLLAVARTLFSN